MSNTIEDFLWFYRLQTNGISIPKDNQDDHLDDNDDLNEEIQEKQLEDELDNLEPVYQMQTNMSIPPGVAEMATQTNVSTRRFQFLSKIPFVDLLFKLNYRNSNCFFCS